MFAIHIETNNMYYYYEDALFYEGKSVIYKFMDAPYIVMLYITLVIVVLELAILYALVSQRRETIEFGGKIGP